jgi:hypothetical protein
MTASAGPALKRLHQEFGDRVEFVSLYVREGHPGERYPQPETFEQKLRHARDYRERDGIPWPVAVDSLEGDLHRALDPKPNAAYLMDTAGNVAFRSLFSNDEGALRRGLEAAASGRAGAVGETQTYVLPALAGMGKMYETLLFAGEEAQRDFLRESAPMYGFARLAALFRPLPPLGRGIAALTTSLLGAGALLGGVRWLSRRTRSR